MAKERVSMKGMGADALFAPPAEQGVETSSPLSQDTSKEAKQETSIEASQDTSKEALKKVSYYIRKDQDIKLEKIKLKRKEGGQETDKSALVREAIDKLLEE